MGAVAVTAAGLLKCMRFFKHMWVSHFGIVAVGVSIDVLVGDGGCHSGVGVVGCASFFGALFVFVLFRRGLGELSLLLLDELSKITAFASFQVGSRVIGGSVIMLMLGCGAGSAHWLEDSLEGIMLMLGCGAGSAHSIEDSLEVIMLVLGCGAGSAHSFEDSLAVILLVLMVTSVSVSVSVIVESVAGSATGHRAASASITVIAVAMSASILALFGGLRVVVKNGMSS